MSLPRRPDSHEPHTREQRSAYRNSPSRRRQPHEEDSAYLAGPPNSSSRHQRGPSKSSFAETLPSPLTPTATTEPLAPSLPHDRARSPEISRKKSLIRPERGRIDQNHPNYYYRQHA